MADSFDDKNNKKDELLEKSIKEALDLQKKEEDENSYSDDENYQNEKNQHLKERVHSRDLDKNYSESNYTRNQHEDREYNDKNYRHDMDQQREEFENRRYEGSQKRRYIEDEDIDYNNKIRSENKEDEKRIRINDILVDRTKKKVAVITGANKGIGKAIAFELAKRKMNIALVYHNDDFYLHQTISDLEAIGLENDGIGLIVKAYQCNVADYKSTSDVAAYILKDFGKVDVLVNNAGITKDMLIMSMGEYDFDCCIEVNLKGAFFFIKHFYRNFIKNKYGRIINISSVSGLSGNAGQANYCSSKAGLIGLSKSVARELASRNVTCNAVAPGFIETAMTKKIDSKTRKELLDRIPLKRLGNPEDVAGIVGFLASDAASYITGQVFVVDGGLIM